MSCSVGANSVRPLTAKVITVSDRSFRGEREDLSGPAVKNLLERAGYAVGAVEVLPDEQPRIASALIHAADEEKLALIVTTGGTGFAPRDVTPEATIKVCEKLTPVSRRPCGQRLCRLRRRRVCRARQRAFAARA